MNDEVIENACEGVLVLRNVSVIPTQEILRPLQDYVKGWGRVREELVQTLLLHEKPKKSAPSKRA